MVRLEPHGQKGGIASFQHSPDADLPWQPRSRLAEGRAGSHGVLRAGRSADVRSPAGKGGVSEIMGHGAVRSGGHCPVGA